MKKIDFNNLIINLSLIFVLCVITLRPYLVKINGQLPLIIMLIANLLLIINLFAKRKIRKKSLTFSLLCCAIVVPSLYMNAYYQDRMNTMFYLPFSICSFSILLFFSKLKNNNIKKIFQFLLIFSLVTSIVTWISFIKPSLYVKIFIPLLPTSSQQIVVQNFLVDGMRMGLTDHYSRNAFYIVLGIISILYFYLRDKSNKKNIILLLFLLCSLFLVGKRGHLIFLIISLIASFFIYNKVSLKTLLKFLVIIISFAFLASLAIKFIPGTSNIVYRFINITSGTDITSGRSELYKKAWKLYEGNNFKGIGWGQFSKSTNYYFSGVHNDYLQILCETGVFGFLCIIISNFIILIKSIKMCQFKKNNETFCILVYNIFFLSYSMTGVPHFDIETNMIYFIFNCILYYLAEEKKYENKYNNSAIQ